MLFCIITPCLCIVPHVFIYSTTPACVVLHTSLFIFSNVLTLQKTLLQQNCSKSLHNCTMPGFLAVPCSTPTIFITKAHFTVPETRLHFVKCLKNQSCALYNTDRSSTAQFAGRAMINTARYTAPIRVAVHYAPPISMTLYTKPISALYYPIELLTLLHNCKTHKNK